jgi:uncharacterized Zn-binding protein involved in type VI secretion
MSEKLSRVGDKNDRGGMILDGANTVFANNKKVGLHTSDISPHPKGKKHKRAKTTGGSPTVFAEGKPVLRTGSGNTCGHKIIEGSNNVRVQ